MIRVGAILASLLACSHIVAQAQVPRAENLLTAREFLRVAYPQLTVMDPVVQFVNPSGLTGPLQFFRFRVYVNETASEIEPTQYANVLLSTEFTFDDTGRIENYFGDGRLLNASQNEKLFNDVTQHPEWSDERITAELKQRGARFGPDRGAELLATLLIRNFEPMLGELTLLSSEFKIPTARERREGLGAGDLKWSLTLQSTGIDIYLSFEPFGGNLTSVITRRRR